MIRKPGCPFSWSSRESAPTRCNMTLTFRKRARPTRTPSACRADAHVENRLPSPEGQRAVQAGQAGRKDLDNYFAIVYETMLSPFNRNEIISVHLVWRKGDKWRLEYCNNADGRRFPKLLPAGVDLSAWWQTEFANLVCVPDLVCDGARSITVKPATGSRLPACVPTRITPRSPGHTATAR